MAEKYNVLIAIHTDHCPPKEVDTFMVPLIEERLGQLYEAKGNAAKAADHYGKFIELWKNADPELQPRVEDAKRRRARLVQEGGKPKR